MDVLTNRKWDRRKLEFSIFLNIPSYLFSIWNWVIIPFKVSLQTKKSTYIEYCNSYFKWHRNNFTLSFLKKNEWINMICTSCTNPPLQNQYISRNTLMSSVLNYCFMLSLLWPLLTYFLHLLILWAFIPIMDDDYEYKTPLHFHLTAFISFSSAHKQSASFPIVNVFKDLWLQTHFITVHVKHICLHKPLSSVLINTNDWRGHWIKKPAVFQGMATGRAEASKVQSENTKEIKVKDLGGRETYSSVIPYLSTEE